VRLPWGPKEGGYCGCMDDTHCGGCGVVCAKRFDQKRCCRAKGGACGSADDCCSGGCINGHCECWTRFNSPDRG
jgi:hypothetical protein